MSVICFFSVAYFMVLMDIKMPNKDGYSAAKEIKGFCSDLPIIAQSAYTFGQFADQFADNPFDGYVQKPISMLDLKKAISSWVCTNNC